LAGKILIVDDVSTNRILLKVKLTSACYQTVQASTGAEAISAARTEQPDLALIDLGLPDIDGLDVCRRLRADPLTRHIPLIAVTADTSDATRIEALRAGAADVYRKPVEDIVLLARIRGLLRAREAAEELGMRDLTYREFGFAEATSDFAPPARIAVVAWHGETAFRWIRILQSQLPDRIRMVVAEEALHEWAPEAVPDLFLICADPARPGDGLRLMSELRSRHATRFSAVCVALPRDAREAAAMALDLGAGDLIEDGADPTEIAHRIRVQIDQKHRFDRLRASVATGLKMALTDPLTGLYNRRYALPHLARIAGHAKTTGRSFAVMLMDLDRFKAINDTYGHAGGDAVLVEVAERFRTNLRAVDLVARIGGEEFLVALPDTSLAAARTTAERLRSVIEERGVRLPSGGTAQVTMSIGLTMSEIGDDGPDRIEALVARADRALLAAKAEGRNQVTVALSAA
jgi:two-component system cell cycle response regulator